MQYENILRCPQCQLKLKYKDESLICNNCQVIYKVENNTYNMIWSKSDKFAKIEQKFWDYTYNQEEERTAENRNSYFHQHFRQPLLDLPNGSLILELGCGSRADSLEIAQSGKNVIATDISPIALKQAKKLAQKMKVESKIHFLLADAEHLPFTDNCFDGVLMAASFHHLKNPLAGLREMKRVVKSNGYIILGVEPNSWPYKSIYKILEPIKKYIRKKRQRGIDSIADDTTEGFGKNQLVKIFKELNLEIIEIKPVKFILEFYDSYIRLKSRMTKKIIFPSNKVQNIITKMDKIFENIPVINNFPWHWNIISRVKK